MGYSKFHVSKPKTTGHLVTSSGRVPGKQFHCSFTFLTYSQSSVPDVQSFDIAISSMVSRLKELKSLKDADVEYYGCLERHQSGEPHYHVLLSLSKQVCWDFRSARKHFLLPENYNRSVNIVVPERGQSTFHFVRNHVAYMQKQASRGDFFGKALSAIREAKKETRIEFDYILSGNNRLDVEARLRKLHPEVLLKNYCNVRQYLHDKFPMQSEFPPYKAPSYIDPSAFETPDEVLKWEQENLMFPSGGRQKCLILIGPSRTGKTQFACWLASRYGTFSSFDFRWAVEGFRPQHKLAVLNDMAYFPEYRPILGCQETYFAFGRYGRTLNFNWASVPSIWTCNDDNDLRKWANVDTKYVNDNAVIVRVEKPLFNLSKEKH